MKKNDDINFLRASLNDEITLPESLSEENIASLVAGEKIRRNNKGTFRRFVAVGVAACIMLTCSLVFMNEKFSVPEKTEDINAEAEQKPSSENSLSHEEILKEIKAYLSDYSDKNLYYFLTDDFLYTEEDRGAVNSAVTHSYAESAKGFSDVNLRVQGVLEADIFMTDGEYLYCVDSCYRAIRIIKAESDGSLKEAAVISSQEDSSFTYTGFYIFKNYLIAGFEKYEDVGSELKEITGAKIYDITDKAAPVFIKEITIDGRYVSSRVTDGKLILISDYSIVRYFGCSDDSLLIPDTYNGNETKKIAAEDIEYLRGENPDGYVNIAVQSLDDISSLCNTSSFLGSTSDTYCTAETLYTISYDYDYSTAYSDRFIGGPIITADNVNTKITAIDISGEKAEYKKSGEIKGSILNDYSIDYYNGFLRIAVNKGKENCIYVLDENLEITGSITGIAEGEQIKSARFTENYAYVVTFRQTDPLYVIDLSDPYKPEIKGEVKLPGFSSYLHPVGEGLLAGIGYGGTETGVDGSGKISLFDVSDPENPKELDSLVFPNANLGTHSKNFCSVSENSFLVTYEKWTDEFVDDDNFRGFREYTGALYISAKDKELVLEGSYLACSASCACRSAFIDNNVYIYGISSGVASFERDSGKLISALGGMDEIFSFIPVNRPAENILF